MTDNIRVLDYASFFAILNMKRQVHFSPSAQKIISENLYNLWPSYMMKFDKYTPGFVDEAHTKPFFFRAKKRELFFGKLRRCIFAVRRSMLRKINYAYCLRSSIKKIMCTYARCDII